MLLRVLSTGATGAREGRYKKVWWGNVMTMHDEEAGITKRTVTIHTTLATALVYSSLSTKVTQHCVTGPK
jgi:hypothetical protein